MRHVYDLSNEDFHSLTRMIRSDLVNKVKNQRAFEVIIIAKKWKFDRDYNYTGIMNKVELVCPNGHRVFISPKELMDSDGNCERCASVKYMLCNANNAYE